MPERLLSAVPDTLLLFDREGRLSAWHLPPDLDPEPCGLIATPEAGMRFRDLLPPTIADFAGDIAALAIETGKAQTVDFGDQADRHFGSRLLPQRDGLMVVLSDISERKRMELNLAQARQRAQAADRAKTAFLAHMSHDLRTPITTVVGMLELLREAEFPLELRDAVDLAYRGARDQLRLLDDILDISRMESGDLEMERLITDLPATVRQVVDTLDYQADSKGLDLELEGPDRMPRIVTDPARLRQILYNLISNAIKYTERGRVTVRIDGCENEAGEFDCAISVHDTGPGIPADRVASIFRPFTRDERHETNAAGHGLGLTICQSLARAMGGTLAVESTPGAGSTFSLRLQTPTAEGDPADNPLTGLREVPASGPTVDLSGLRILVAEDDPSLQRMMRFLLEDSLRMRCDTVDNGLDAVERVTTGRYDCVLMDCSMPKLGGIEATTRIRQLPGPSGQTPVIALTAHADRTTRDRCLAKGMDDCLIKPFTRSSLIETLNRIVGTRRWAAGLASDDDPDASTEPASAAGPAAGVGTGATSIDDRAPELDEQAIADILELAGSDDSAFRFLTGLIADLREWSPKLDRDLATALTRSDHDTAERLAHRAKSRCRMLGLARAAAGFAELERIAAEQGESSDAAARAVSALHAGLTGVEAWVRANLTHHTGSSATGNGAHS